MAEPLARRLRPAPHRGLTSPDPVRTALPERAPRPRPRARNPDKPQNGRAAQRPRPDSPPENSSCSNRTRNELPKSGRWIEAKNWRDLNGRSDDMRGPEGYQSGLQCGSKLLPWPRGQVPNPEYETFQCR
jgi:hypothetical protein